MRKFLRKIRPLFAKYHKEDYDMIMGELMPARWRPRLWVLIVWTIIGFTALFLLRHL